MPPPRLLVSFGGVQAAVSLPVVPRYTGSQPHGIQWHERGTSMKANPHVESGACRHVLPGVDAT
jgi:hypothetical protein